MRWGCLQFAIDRIEDGDEILCHIIIPKADHAIAVGGEFRRAFIIRGQFIRMLAAVELDDELFLRTREIGDAIADRVLATEFVERKTLAEGAPENVFGAG